MSPLICYYVKNFHPRRHVADERSYQTKYATEWISFWTKTQEIGVQSGPVRRHDNCKLTRQKPPFLRKYKQRLVIRKQQPAGIIKRSKDGFQNSPRTAALSLNKTLNIHPLYWPNGGYRKVVVVEYMGYKIQGR